MAENFPFMSQEIDLEQVITVARDRAGASDEAVQKASENPHFSAEVRARLKVSTKNALANIQIITERAKRAGHSTASIRKRLVDILNDHKTPPWIRFRKVYALLDEAHSFNEGNVACRKGCAHCCHIPVALPEVEAEMLGMALGRKPKKVAKYQTEGHYREQSYGYHTPCPFLKDNQCSIYEHRPAGLSQAGERRYR